MKKVVRSENVDRDVREELSFHLAMREREFLEQGFTPDAARSAAIASFGDVAQVETQLLSERIARNSIVRRREWVESVMQDIRVAVRGLVKRPLFAATTVTALGLGIGAAGSIAAVVNGILLAPMPYAAPNSLAMIWLRAPTSMGGDQWPVSAGFYDLIRTKSQTFASVAAFRSAPSTFGSAEGSERVAAVRATPGLFETLGTRPILGRLPNEQDALTGAPPIVLVSHAFWTSRLGGSPGVIGRRIALNGVDHEVIGIMPTGFSFPRGSELMRGLQFEANTQLWTPLGFTQDDLQNYGTQNLAVIGRLKPGQTRARAEGEVRSLVTAALKDLGSTMDVEAQVIGLREQAAAPVRRTLLLVLGAVALVLIIACTNVAALLLARLNERRHELAVRLALGARASRVTRQLVTETLALAVVGGACGTLFTTIGTRLLVQWVPADLPRLDDIALGPSIFGAVAMVTAGVWGVFGAVVRRRAHAGDAGDALRFAARATDHAASKRGRRILVVAQVALSVVLLVACGLLLRSFINLQRVELGFAAPNTLVVDVSLPVVGAFDPVKDGAAWRQALGDFAKRVNELPGVTAAGGTSVMPLSGTAEGGAFSIVGQEPAKPEDAPRVAYAITEGDYFKALGIRLLRGRAFVRSDVATSPPVAIISKAAAERYFAGQDPVGSQVRASFEFSSNPPPRTIVGVVDNVRLGALDAEFEPTLYVPQQQMSYPGLAFAVRASVPAEQLEPLLRRELRAISPTAALSKVRTTERLVRGALARQRFVLSVIGAFALAALGLAVVGLYGVIAMSVQARRRELGVRLALGARPVALVRLVLGDGLQIAGIGVAVGLVAALALSGTIRALLFGVAASDVAVLGGAAALVLAVAFLASLGPARRAARGNPTEALRAEA